MHKFHYFLQAQCMNYQTEGDMPHQSLLLEWDSQAWLSACMLGPLSHFVTHRCQMSKHFVSQYKYRGLIHSPFLFHSDACLAERREEKPFFSFFFCKNKEIPRSSLISLGYETEMIQCQQLPSASFPWLKQNSEEKSCVAISHLFFGQGFAHILGQAGQVSSKQ